MGDFHLFRSYLYIELSHFILIIVLRFHNVVFSLKFQFEF